LQAFVTGSEVVQPGEGECLFLSLDDGAVRGETSVGFGGPKTLRRESAIFIKKNPELKIDGLGGETLRAAIKSEKNMEIEPYVREMRRPGRWGGTIEIAVCAHLKKVRIDVYVPAAARFKLIAGFGSVTASYTISVVYKNQAHYDGLEVGVYGWQPVCHNHAQ